MKLTTQVKILMKMLPQGRSYGWSGTEAKRCQDPHSHLPRKSSVVLVWWYQGWGAMTEIWTHFLAVKGAGKGAAIAQRSGGDTALVQDLAQDTLMYDATVHAYFTYPKPKRGVFRFFQDQGPQEDGLAGKITSSARECIDKV